MDYYSKGKIPCNATRELSNEDYPSSSHDKLDETLVSYSSTMGSFMHTLMCTRLDLAYTVGVFHRFQSNPRKHYSKKVK